MRDPLFQRVGTAIGAAAGEPLLAVTLGRGTSREALLSFPVFFPELAEVDGHVLLYSEQFETRDELRRRFRAALAGLGASPTDHELADLERTFNVFEVVEGFVSRPPSDPTDEAVAAALADAVRAAWQSRLVAAYPGRHFRVEVLENDVDPLSVVFSEDRGIT